MLSKSYHLVIVIILLLQGIIIESFGQTDTTVVGITRTPNTPNIAVSAGTITIGQTSVLTVSNCNNGIVKWNNGQVGNPITVKPTVTQSFYARCIVSGCVGDSSGVKVSVITETPTINVSKSAICQGESSKLTAIGCAGTIEWSTGQNGLEITVSPSVTTSYSVTCINSNVRSNPATTTITVNSVPAKPTITASTTTPILGGSVTLTGNCSNSNYLWSTKETTSSITRIPTQNESITLVCVSSTGCFSDSDVKLLTPISPSIGVNPSKDKACAGETISLTVTGCPNNSVTWSTGDNSNTIYTILTQTTTYEVSCKFSTGTVKASTTVIAIPLPNAPTIINSNPSILKGGKSILTAVGCEDGTKIWQYYGSERVTNSDTIIVYPTQTNTFKVACSKNYCTGGYSSTVVTIVGSDAKAIASPNQICQGDTSQLTLNNCSGTISWSNGKTGKTITVKPNITTTYKAYCQIGNTKDSSSVEVKVIPIPTDLIISATYNNKILSIKDTVAINSPITLELKNCSGTINWNIGISGSKILIYPLETQVYTATCVNQNGCKSVPISTSFIVRSTQLSLIVSKSAICQGDYATVTSKGCPAEQLSWKFVPDANLDLIKSPLSISFKPSVTTKVIAFCKLNDLQTLKDSTVITVLPRNFLKVDSATICIGKSVDLSKLVSNPTLFSSIKFYDGSKEVKIVTPTGVAPFTKTYKVIGINNSGCKDSTIVGINVKPIPDKPLIKSDKVSFPILYGEKVNLMVDNCINGTVTWISPFATTKSILVTPVIKTTYKAICTSPYGCGSDTASITIDVTRQIAKITSPKVICEDVSFEINSNCQTNTLWGGPNSYIDGNTITVKIPRDGDSILVKGKPIFRRIIRNDSTFVTGQATCLFQDVSTTFKSKSTYFEVYVPVISINDLYFYPNPTTKIIKVGSNSCLSPAIQVRIWDLMSRMLYDSSQTPIKDNEIDISELSSGEYIVEIIYDSNKIVKKMIKYTNN